jgi:hypothetical protein
LITDTWKANRVLTALDISNNGFEFKDKQKFLVAVHAKPTAVPLALCSMHVVDSKFYEILKHPRHKALLDVPSTTYLRERVLRRIFRFLEVRREIKC